MSIHRDVRDDSPELAEHRRERPPLAPGKRTLTSALAEVMRLGAGPAPGVTPELRSALESEPGSPMPDAGRYSEEIGADVSHARAVTGSGAAAAARSIGAQAFTVGDRVFFGDGGFQPGTPAGDHVIRHELTHVAQQAGAAMPPLDALQISAPGSAAEVEAHQVAEAGGAGAIGSQPAQVARFDYEKIQETQVGGNSYSWWNAKELYFGFGTRLVDMPLAAPPFITWTEGTAKFLEGFVHQMLALGRGEFTEWAEVARKVVMPEDFRELVNRGRVIFGTKKDDKTSEVYDTGPRRFQDSSALPLVHAIHRRLIESLQRMAPRFLAASSAAAESGETVDPDAIIASHPCDYVLILTLARRTDLVGVDLAGYRAQAASQPQVAHDATAGPSEITWRFLDEGWGPNWIEVTDPAGVTAETLAQFLYGSAQESTRIVASPPYFGLPMDSARDLRIQKGMSVDHWSVLLGAHMVPWLDVSQKVLENERDPAFGLLRSGASEQAALSEAATGEKANAGADRGAILRILERTRNGLAACAQFVAPFGLDERLSETIGYIDGRLSFFTTATDQDVGRWFVQVEKQDDVVGRASMGLEQVDRHLRAMGIADISQIGRMPKAVRIPLERVAGEFVDAAVLSRLVATAENRVEKAELDLRLAPLDTMEIILKDIQTRVYLLRSIDRKHHPNETEWQFNEEDELWDQHLDEIEKQLEKDPNAKIDEKWEPPKPVPYQNADAGSQASMLQEELLVLRGKMLAGTSDVGPEIQELYKKIDKLSAETEIAQGYALLSKANEDVLSSDDSAWAVVANGVTGNLFEASDMWLEGEGYKFWFEYAWSYYQRGNIQEARKVLAENLGNDEGFKTFLQRAYDTIEDTQTRVMILKIATLVGIVLVTMGFGALAEGVAGALGAGEIGAFIVGASVEAASFTLLDHMLFGTDDMAGTLTTEFAANLATFGLMRAWRLRKAAKVADDAMAAAKLENATKLEKMHAYLLKGKELTGEVLIMAAAAYAQMQVDSLRQRGEFVSLSEIRDHGKQGLAMVLGIAVGGRLFRHELDELRRLGHQFGEDLGKRLETLRDMAKRVEVTKQPDLALELVRQDRALMEKELELRQRRDDPTGQRPPQLDEAAAAHRALLGEAELTLALDEVVPGRVYMGTPDQIDPILKRLEADGATVKPVDENGRKRYEVEQGEKRFTINEAQHYSTRSGGAVVPAGGKIQQFEPNSVVGYVDSVAEGREVMRRLAAGDRTALGEIGYDTFPSNLETNKVEWGLARRWDGALTVVLGGFTDINWAVLPHMKPLSHSHPFMPQMALKGRTGDGAVRIDELADLSDDMRHLFPSAADFGLMARGGIRDHVVHTPFVARPDGRVTNPGAGETGPTVDFVIEKSTYVGRWAGAEEVGVYRATVTARTPDGTIWRGEIYAVDAGASMLYKSRPPISGSRLGPPGGKFETRTGSANAVLVGKLRRAGMADPSSNPTVQHVLDSLSPQAQRWLEDLVDLQPARVRGVAEWVEGVGNRPAGQVEDLSIEIRETLRMVDEHPDLVFDVGADLRAPMKPGSTTERDKSFDVEGVKGTPASVERSVEIKSLGEPVQSPNDLWGVLKKTGGKLSTRKANGQEIAGFRESRINIHFYRGPVGKNAVRRGGDRYKDFDGSGNYRYLKKADDTEISTGNILDDVTDYLNNKPSLNDLDQLTLVDDAGVLATYTNDGRTGTWRRNP